MLRRPEAAWHLPLTCQRHPLRTGFYVPAWYMLLVAARAGGRKKLGCWFIRSLPRNLPRNRIFARPTRQVASAASDVIESKVQAVCLGGLGGLPGETNNGKFPASPRRTQFDPRPGGGA